MRTHVVTGWSPAGWIEYARDCMATFDQLWPQEVSLTCFVEAPIDPWPFGPRAFQRFLPADCIDFMARHAADPGANGERPDGSYSYRFDAVKFCRQLYIPHAAAAEFPDGDIVAWLDADVLTVRPPPANVIGGMLKNWDCCYLGRGAKHSEIGFWAVRLNPITRAFLEGLASVYTSDEVFSMKEHHSAFVWDTVRRRHQVSGPMMSLDLTNGKGHVWFDMPLGRYTDHLKGDRKALRRSPERPW